MALFRLQSLPGELVDLIIAHLPYEGLCDLSLASQWCYAHAVPFLWKDLRLVDTETTTNTFPQPNHDAHRDSTDERHEAVPDQHDETRILQKLFILATNPYVASKVQTILHRCHLPTPELFQELPCLRHDDSISYPTDTLRGSQHYGTYARLVLQAVANMTNVHTLRIVLGHCGLTQALVWGLFGPHREANVPVRRLWLESCCIRSPSYHDIWTPLDFSQVESLRLRRLWFQFVPALAMLGGASHDRSTYCYTRDGNNQRELRNSTAGFYAANVVYTDDPLRTKQGHPSDRAFQSIMSHLPSVSYVRFVRSLAAGAGPRRYQSSCANSELRFDSLRSAYKLRSLDSALRLLAPYPATSMNAALWPRGNWEHILTDNGFSVTVKDEGNAFGAWQRARLDLAYFQASSCLTSLTLDWVIFQQGSFDMGYKQEQLSQGWRVLSRLCELTFPNLQAFQMRNCVTGHTRLGHDIFLFAKPLGGRKELIDFLEAHTSLRCLAWPIAHFFPPRGVLPNMEDRVRRVVTNLGRTLTELRVDATLTTTGERKTDQPEKLVDMYLRSSRRLFISDFADHMRALTSMKLEGGIPRDEKREVIRALRRCPLTKVVFIGASFPLANTWGEDGRYLEEHDVNSLSYMILESEDEEMLEKAMIWNPSATNDNSDEFSARFGPDEEPILHTIAGHHAKTIRELKFCGYSGAPMLRHHSRLTTSILHHLRYFDSLQELVMSFWISTLFDGDSRDEAIISYWFDIRQSTSRAIAIIPNALAPTNPDLQQMTHPGTAMLPTMNTAEVNPVHEAATDAPLNAASWLYDNYHPTNLANTMREFIGPYLSPRAKSQHGGVRVRASFCLGTSAQDIFDFDVRLGIDLQSGDDVVLEHLGPREDRWDGGRSKEKLENRRWF